MTIKEALTKYTAILKTAGIESPALDAAILLTHVLNISRSKLAAMSRDERLSEKDLRAFITAIDRRLNGECIAYITGKKEFYGLEFSVNKSVLVPRPDTEILVEAAIDFIKRRIKTTEGTEDTEYNLEHFLSPLCATLCNSVVNNKNKILDLCTGSGAVAIALKHTVPELEVWATDISSEALDVAKKNADCLLPPDSINFLQGDLYNALHSINYYLLPFTCIVSNAPYIPSKEIQSLSAEVQYEPHLALDGGSDGLDLIKKIIAKAPEYLCPGGILLLEADPRQMKNISALLEQAGFHKIIIRKDISGLERVIGGVMRSCKGLGWKIKSPANWKPE